MRLTRAEVEEVSVLARLQLQEDELDEMTVQLSQIIEYVELLGEINTDDVPPMAHGVERFNVFSADEHRVGLDRDEALANAPKRDEECYRGPAVLGD